MIVDTEDLRRIANHLSDDISREVFSNRLLYSITGESGYLRNICRTIPEAAEFEQWLSKHEEMGKVLFGAGKWGDWIRETYDNYNWDCYADNNVYENVAGKIPVIGFDDLCLNHKNAAVIITSKYHYNEIFDQLIKAGFDEENVYVLGKVVEDIESRIYFDLPQLKKLQVESFADVGGYDGETTKAFSRWAYGEWRSKIFEPGKANIKMCLDNLSDVKDRVDIIPKGVWDFETTLSFNEEGSESCISDKNGIMINMTTIDKEYVDEPCTFIKMDIEGSEIPALKGAEKTIKRYKPKLAISIYHKEEDIIEIPKLIIQLNSDYRLYLRHYSLAYFDTVLYAF